MKICPIMAQGWLANRYSAQVKVEDSWKIERLPKCLEEGCALWDEANHQCSYKTQQFEAQKISAKKITDGMNLEG